MDELEQKLLDEQAIIAAGGLPAFQFILSKLDAAADEMLNQYDTCDFAKEPEKAMRIQIYRRMVKIEIPRMVENIVNAGRLPEEKTTFAKWLRKLF